ncbi:MAG: HAMP domain-containing protein [Gammaproteobacteria bacterium]|nr:HAMP domain-containing protein [Gammaproteobacteria bacterium]
MKNINVSIKLAFGLGAILLLIVALAANSLYNINQILMRGDNTLQLTKIDNASRSLLVASAQYKLTENEHYIQETQSLINDIRQIIKDVTPKLTEERGKASIAQISKNIDDYEKAFNGNSQAQQNKAANLVSAVNSGAQANALFSELKTLINGSAENPTFHEDYYDTVTGRLAADLAEARHVLAYTARVFLMEGTDQSLQRLESSFNALQDINAKLQPRVPEQTAAMLKDAMVALESYMEVLRHSHVLSTAQLEAEHAMNAVYANLRTNIDELLEIQTNFRAKVANSSKITSVTLSLIAIVLAVLIGFTIVKQITSPLNQAVRIAQAIGNRDMTGTAIEPRGDEFGTLLKALEQTRANLSEALGEVGGITTQLAAAAEELSVVTNQTSAGVNNQRIETEQVATAMNEMSATVQEVAQNAEEAAAAAQKADTQAKTGNKALQVALADINQLSEDVNHSAEAIQRLNKDSSSIGTVLTVINSIAEQTNLLALNAAIEAARAGEAGRGFAVVADEVRNLAHRTQESIGQIEQLIANLQHGSQNAVEMMDNSRTMAHLTLEHAQQAGDELAAIMRTVSEIQAMNIQIATAAEEQSAVAEEINASVVNVNNIADQSAAAVEETSASSAELARLGQSLQSLVARFKI